jgi:NAD+ kinase
VPALRRAVELITAAGAGVVVVPSEESRGLAPSDLPMADPGEVSDAALVVAFGGDGTFLRAARLARSLDVPIVGVNVGRLGFLTEIDPEDLPTVVPRLIAGDFAIDRRATLDARILDAAGSISGELWALNDIAVEKVVRQRLVRLEVHVGATLFANVAADAVIVATSTGSTAYALSAGGPIVNPALDAVLVAPVAPHSLFDRTIVTHRSDRVRIVVARDQEGALVSCDGTGPMVLEPGGAVEVSGDGRPVLVARLGAADFFGLVRRKFRLA